MASPAYTDGLRAVCTNEKGEFLVLCEEDGLNDNAAIARFYGPDAEGNAILDAAAPELLEALKAAREAAHPLLQHGEDNIWRRAKIVVDVADAAIAKAEGRVD